MLSSRHVVLAALLLAQGTARAQAEPAPAPAEPSKPDETRLTFGGYLEAYYQASFQDPSNRITNLRGYDSRSRSVTLSSVALDVKGERGPVAGHVVLQFGHTPSTVYLAEPVSPGTASVDTSSGELWKYLQTATVAVQGPRATTIEAGLFTSPIGIEVFPVKDNWNLSRSNLFFGLPAYHAGARISHPIAEGWTGTLALYNGWNTVVDNNGYPSVAVSAAYASPTTTAQLLYFGGIERPTGAPEGKPWRHLFDALVQVAVTSELSVAAHADAGFEPNDIGTSSWIAAALYGKLALSDQLYAAVRGDVFYESVPEAGGMTAGAMFWPTKWVAEGTATLAYQPVNGVSLRLEYRHDRADADAFFGGTVAGDGATAPYVVNRKSQDTATLGLAAWF